MPSGRNIADRSNVSVTSINAGNTTRTPSSSSRNLPSAGAGGLQSAAPPLLEEMERELRNLIVKFDVIAVAVCDRDGAFLCKVFNDSKADGIFQKSMLNQRLINSSENLAKLDIGSITKVLLEYDRYQIMKFFHGKFIVTFIAGPQVPTGTLFSLEPDCHVIFQTLREYFD